MKPKRNPVGKFGVTVAIALLLTGCSSPVESAVPVESSNPPAEAVVTDEGFAVSLDGVLVVGAAGVAPVGTAVALSQVTDDLLSQVDGATFVPGLFHLALGDGLTPTSEVTVSWLSNDAVSLSSLAFLTEDAETSAWVGVPVGFQDDLPSVQVSDVDHFGWLDGSQVLDLLVAGVKAYAAEPAQDSLACEGEVADSAGLSYSAASSDPAAMKVCFNGFQDVAGLTNLEVYANDYRVWTLVAGPSSTLGSGSCEGCGMGAYTLSGQLISQAHEKLAQGAEETTVNQPSAAEIPIQPGATAVSATATVDADLSLVSLLVPAVTYALLGPGTDQDGGFPYTDDAGVDSISTCWASALSADADRLGLMTAAANCLAPLEPSIYADTTDLQVLTFGVYSALAASLAEELLNQTSAVLDDGRLEAAPITLSVTSVPA